jgi:hypothetical protein
VFFFSFCLGTAWSLRCKLEPLRDEECAWELGQFERRARCVPVTQANIRPAAEISTEAPVGRLDFSSGKSLNAGNEPRHPQWPIKGAALHKSKKSRPPRKQSE